MRYDNATSYEDLVRLDARWAHADLLPFVGRRVWMSGSDYWRQECNALQSRRVTARGGG